MKGKEDKIKGGKSDKLSIEDVAEKQGVSVKAIKDEVEVGKKIEREHTDTDELAEEIALDHIYEFKDYYTGKNGLINTEKKMEKQNESKVFIKSLLREALNKLK
jgi:predicted DNA-binding protein YlxM (UPF0122 family)